MPKHRQGDESDPTPKVKSFRFSASYLIAGYDKTGNCQKYRIVQ